MCIAPRYFILPDRHGAGGGIRTRMPRVENRPGILPELDHVGMSARLSGLPTVFACHALKNRKSTWGLTR